VSYFQIGTMLVTYHAAVTAAVLAMFGLTVTPQHRALLKMKVAPDVKRSHFTLGKSAVLHCKFMIGAEML